MDDEPAIDKAYGIHRIFRFAKKKNNKVYITDKKELVNLETTNKATVVKVEFTNDNCFILLSDGRVMSKGKDECLGRLPDNTDGVSKKFGIVEFINTEKEEDGGINSTIYNISAGDEHILALDKYYNVWSWGSNKYRQCHPKAKNDFKRPQKIVLPSEVKVSQIFALNRTSMVVCQGNIVYMWGSISEGFIGNFKDQIATGNKLLTEFVRMDRLTNFIQNDIKKNTQTYTETFINSRKLFNTKYNQTLEDNYNKQVRIDKLNSQIKNLKLDIEQRQKQSTQLMNTLSIKSADKRIISLQDLLRTYEEKLNNISLKKDRLRKELINIEEEINQKDLDLRANTEQIDVVEDQMESYNNEITEIKAKLSEDKDKNIEFIKSISEKNAKLYNLKNYKESLMTNLQVLIVFLEMKEKERNDTSKQISLLTNKENQFLKARYTVEDMIQILQESITNSLSSTTQISEKNPMMNANSDKFKEKYLELFKFNDKLDKITFSNLNKTFPYKIIEDLVEYSNSELKNIIKDLELAKSSLSEMIKENLRIIFDMIESKIELIREQNQLISNLYTIFGNLEKEIKEREQEAFKDSLTNNIHKEKEYKSRTSNVVGSLNSHIEFIFKDLILEFLKEVYRIDEVDDFSMSNEEKERLLNEKSNYVGDKQSNVKKLETRSKYLEEAEKTFDMNNVISFGYGKNEENKGSMFSWMGNIFS
jgi:hypothetical protein